MPWTEDDCRVCGALLKKTKSGTWIRRFVVLDFPVRILKLYTEDVEYKVEAERKHQMEEYDLAKITTVKNTANPPKMFKFCFELSLSSSGVLYFSAEVEKDREAWVEAFRRVATNQGFSGSLQTRERTNTVIEEEEAQKEVFRTKVIGGVVVKQSVGQEKVHNKAVEATLKTDFSQAMEKTTVIKAGFAIKQGAVRKNWKRRFFVLTQRSFAYYRNIEDSEPLRTIDAHMISGASSSSIFKDKDFLLEIHTPERKFYVQCESEEECVSWKAAFAALPHLQSGAEQQTPNNTTASPTNGSQNEEPIDDDSYESDDGPTEL